MEWQTQNGGTGAPLLFLALTGFGDGEVDQGIRQFLEKHYGSNVLHFAIEKDRRDSILCVTVRDTNRKGLAKINFGEIILTPYYIHQYNTIVISGIPYGTLQPKDLVEFFQTLNLEDPHDPDVSFLDVKDGKEKIAYVTFSNYNRTYVEDIIPRIKTHSFSSKWNVSLGLYKIEVSGLGSIEETELRTQFQKWGQILEFTMNDPACVSVKYKHAMSCGKAAYVMKEQGATVNFIDEHDDEMSVLQDIFYTAEKEKLKDDPLPEFSENINLIDIDVMVLQKKLDELVVDTKENFHNPELIKEFSETVTEFSEKFEKAIGMNIEKEEMQAITQEWKNSVNNIASSVSLMLATNPQSIEQVIEKLNITLAHVASDPLALKYCVNKKKELKKKISKSQEGSDPKQLDKEIEKNFVQYLESMGTNTQEMLTLESGVITTEELRKLNIDVKELIGGGNAKPPTEIPSHIHALIKKVYELFEGCDFPKDFEDLLVEIETNRERYEEYFKEAEPEFVDEQLDVVITLKKEKEYANIKTVKDGFPSHFIKAYDLLTARLYSCEKPKIYQILNRCLRDTLSLDPTKRENAKEQLAHFNSFIHHLQTAIIALPGPEKPLLVFRGQTVPPEGIQSWQIGDEIVWPGFTSCSTNEDTAFKFSNGKVFYEISIQPGQGCLLKEYSFFPSDQVVLLPAFCNFRITNLKKKDRFNKVDFMVFLECLYIDDNGNEEKWEAIFKAAWEGNIQEISKNKYRHLIRNNPDKVNKIGQTLLYTAAHKGDDKSPFKNSRAKVVKYILDQNISPCVKVELIDPNGQKKPTISTALHCAAYYRQVETCRILLNSMNVEQRKKWATEVQNSHGLTALEESKRCPTEKVFNEFKFFNK